MSFAGGTNLIGGCDGAGIASGKYSRSDADEDRSSALMRQFVVVPNGASGSRPGQPSATLHGIGKVINPEFGK